MINGLKQGVYLANVTGRNFSKTVRLVNNACISNELNISYIGHESLLLKNKTTKSTNINSFLNYFSGDLLFFKKAYKGDYIRIVTDIPHFSKLLILILLNVKILKIIIMLPKNRFTKTGWLKTLRQLHIGMGIVFLIF